MKILTGHTHSTLLSTHNTDVYGVELRSGTALQGNSRTNEFLAHRLHLTSGHVEMRTRAFVRPRGAQFGHGPNVVSQLA